MLICKAVRIAENGLFLVSPDARICYSYKSWMGVLKRQNQATNTFYEEADMQSQIIFDSLWLEELITKHMKTAHVPGVSIAVCGAEGIVYAHGFGTTSLEEGGSAVTPQTLFRIGSTTKVFTGTAILRMVEVGLLDLDCPIKTYLPSWFTLGDEVSARLVTLRMLLSHTSGLPADTLPFGSRNPDGLEKFVRQIIPGYLLMAEPGSTWSYSNPGMNLAGYVAEVVYGKPFTELVQELVFTPLQMTRTTFDPLIAMTYPLALPHEKLPDGEMRVLHRFMESTSEYPSGFCISTALDLTRIIQLHVNNGRFQEQALLSPSSVQAMHTRHVKLNRAAKNEGYGLAFFVDSYQGWPRVLHHGLIDSYGCLLAIIPGQVGIVLLNNYAHEFRAIEIVNALLDVCLSSTHSSTHAGRTEKEPPASHNSLNVSS